MGSKHKQTLGVARRPFVHAGPGPTLDMPMRGKRELFDGRVAYDN